MATTGHENESINVGGLKSSLQALKTKYVDDLDTRVDTLEEAVGSGGSIDTRISNAINALDSTKSQTAGTDGLALSITETDGKITSISGSIATNTYDSYGAATSAANTAKTDVIGGASSSGNTLKKLEDRITPVEIAVGSGGSIDTRISGAVGAETARAQAVESSLSSGKADKATTLAGYGITDAYTKSETYTKTEVNGLVDTPHQEYVTVNAYSALPATGSKDTIYRVSNYNGSTSQVDASVYSEYAWNGSQYIFLCVKSQISEVFDISVYNNNAKYADLAAALNGGTNIPQSLQKGGMSIKFVQSSDNKYVQYRLMSNTWSIDTKNWNFCGNDILVKDAEYGFVELDADKKIMGGRKVNGNKFENMPFEMPSATIESIYDYEKRLCLELDSLQRILSFRKPNGTKVENAGLETTSIKLSEDGLEQLKKDLNVNVNDGDILTLHPKEVVLPILKTFKARPSWFLPYSENYKYVSFNMLWFSDLHHVDRRLTRISKFYNEYKDYIDSVLCSGDALNSYPENFEFWHNNGADSFLDVIGNHECFGGTRTIGNKTLAGWIAPGYSQKECYDKYFKNYLSETGIIIQENKAYWYKDYVLPAKTDTGEIVEGVFAYKIRLIALDYYHWKEGRTYTDGTPMEQWPDGEPLDTGQQQLWLRNLLQDAYDNDYSVICTIHNSMPNNKENTPFQTLEPYLVNYDFSQTEILDEVQTFINYGGKFITWLTGHSHDDRFGVVRSHPDQLMITVGTAGNLIQGPGSQWEFPSFMDRTENTMNDDLFNMVSVNTYAHTISLYRVGCPYDKHGRHLDSIAYDYVNKKIL